jgi:hypothetical protein
MKTAGWRRLSLTDLAALGQDHATVAAAAVRDHGGPGRDPHGTCSALREATVLDAEAHCGAELREAAGLVVSVSSPPFV